ncbi:MAG: LptF/LptG family permease, partial [Pseudomonadota bacterium]
VQRTTRPELLVVALLLLFAWPWGNRNSLELRDRYQQRSDLARVAPGVFQSSSDGRRVFFVEREGADGINARNVFILTQNERGEAVTSARAGRLERSADGRYLVLERGQRNESLSDTGARTLSSFDSYRVLVDEKALREAEQRPPRTVATIDLMLDPTPRHQGELAWRIGLLLGAANLLLLGIGLAATNPRRASNWNLLFALLAFAIYYNLINLAQAWVAGGRLSMASALFGVHGAALALALLLIWWRDHATVAPPWRRQRADGLTAGAAP